MLSQRKHAQKHHVLVVEDEDEVRHLMKQMIEREGYRVLEAANVKEALVHIANWNVDLMLLDLHLSGANGQDLLRLLRRRKWRVPTLVVSAHVSMETTQELLALGVVGIVAKPFKSVRLMEEIQRHLQWV